MKAFLHYFLYEFKAGFRDRSQFFMNWLFPLIVFCMMATLMGGINPAFKAQMVPAMVLFGMLGSGLLFLSGNWINQREAGVFRSYRINRMPAAAILLAPVCACVAHMACVGAIIAALGIAAFGAAAPASALSFAIGWLASALAVCGIGMAIGTLMPNPRAGMVVGQLFFLPSIMLGGLMFPASMLPANLARVAGFLPSRWAMVAMTADRSANAPAYWTSVAVLCATAAVGFIVSLSLFEWHSAPTRKPAWRIAGLAVLAPAALALACGLA